MSLCFCRSASLACADSASADALALPQDHATLCQWRGYVISAWRHDRNIWFSCVEAFVRGMRITHSDFLAIVKEYVDVSSENQTYGRRK